jgi:hypothetical protein
LHTKKDQVQEHISMHWRERWQTNWIF